jgi:H/ACA ribonucleoprotein complex subunit 4
MDIKRIKEIGKKKEVKELLEFSIINIDKSSGPTSFNVSDFVRKKLKLRKTSHFGTLDPKVTGVLPIALNRGCKLTGFFLGEDKEYVGIMRFHDEVEEKKVKECIEKKFLGEITQMPPLKSRVKREERVREIKEFEILEKEGKDFLFRVSCQGGTYIRKLVDDLGKEMGVNAHMLELRRIRAGIFKEDGPEFPSVKLYDFEKAVDEYNLGKEENLRKILIPGEIVSLIHEEIQVKKSEVKRILTGKPIYKTDLMDNKKIEKGEKICAFSGNEFLGVYRVTNEEEIFARPEFVFQKN